MVKYKFDFVMFMRPYSLVKTKGEVGIETGKWQTRERERKEMAVYKPFWSFSPWGGQKHRKCGWTVRTEADKATSCSSCQAHFKNIHSNNAKTTCMNTVKRKQGLIVSMICQIMLVGPSV